MNSNADFRGKTAKQMYRTFLNAYTCSMPRPVSQPGCILPGNFVTADPATAKFRLWHMLNNLGQPDSVLCHTPVPSTGWVATQVSTWSPGATDVIDVKCYQAGYHGTTATTPD